MSNDNKSTVDIEYNPYTVETKIKIDGQSISNESSLKKCNNKRLQYWLDKNRNWQGIIEELKRSVNNAEGINITFKGRKIDFDDLKLTVDKYNANNNIILDFIQGKEDNNILKNIDDIFEKIQNGPIEELKTEKLKIAYEEVKSSKFKISVLATMSSGKSTLINSLIGYELLPSKNMACTATVARITDNATAKEFKAVCRDINENVIYNKNVISLNDIEKYNDDEKVTYIDIEGKIPRISSDKLNLLLYDTPGPNNSRNERHGELTQSVIEDKKKGIVLYVLNATQFGINDDANLLQDISFQMKRGGKQSKDRFIFVINKCDELDTEKGESVDSLLECVKEYLKEYDIEDPNLFPVTAQGSKLIRMFKNGTSFTRKERKELDGIVEDFNDLDGYHFEKKCTLSESCRENIDRKLRYAIENNDKYEEALIHTGIPCIEETINEYLEKYAYPIKISDAISEIKEIIDEKVMKLQLDEKVSKSQKNYDKLREQINNAKEKLEGLEKAKEIINDIENLNIEFKEFDKVIDTGVKKNLDYIGQKYQGKESVVKLEAQKEITKLKKYIENNQIEFKEGIEKAINREVIVKGSLLIEDYNKYLNKLCKELKIDNYDFKKIQGINELDESINFDDAFNKNIKSEDIYKEERRRNTNKRWYKPWTWGEDEFYTVTEKVGEKNMVNMEKVAMDIYGEVSFNFYNNINRAKDTAKEEIEDLKKFFKSKINELNEQIRKSVIELDNNTKSIDDIKLRVEKDKDNKVWFDKLMEELGNIMSI